MSPARLLSWATQLSYTHWPQSSPSQGPQAFSMAVVALVSLHRAMQRDMRTSFSQHQLPHLSSIIHCVMFIEHVPTPVTRPPAVYKIQTAWSQSQSLNQYPDCYKRGGQSGQGLVLTWSRSVSLPAFIWSHVFNCRKFSLRAFSTPSLSFLLNLSVFCLFISLCLWLTSYLSVH